MDGHTVMVLSLAQEAGRSFCSSFLTRIIGIDWCGLAGDGFTMGVLKIRSRTR